MTVTSPSCHTAAPGQGVRVREHFRKEPSHKQPFLLLLHPTATPWSPAPPPGVAPLLLVTSGHVSLHNYGTPLESAAAHCEPDAGLWPTQPPCFSSIPFGGEGGCLSRCPMKWTHTPPKQRPALAPMSKGLHCCTSAALPYLSTQHWACGLPPCTEATIKGK